jgi:hypothetical protein
MARSGGDYFIDGGRTDLTYRCPVTGKLAPSGIRVDSLDSITISNHRRGNCAECGGEHVLNQEDLHFGYPAPWYVRLWRRFR